MTPEVPAAFLLVLGRYVDVSWLMQPPAPHHLEYESESG